MTRPAPMLADGEDTVCLLMKTRGHLALTGNVGAAAARCMLTSPRYETWSVTAIALEAGFGDVSHFNRRSKLRFLMMPTDVRAQFGCKRIPATASDAGLK